MQTHVLKQLLADRAAKRPVVLLSNLTTGEASLLYPQSSCSPVMAEAVRRALAEDTPQQVEVDGVAFFANPFSPPLRLVIVGAVHIARALSRMATMTGYDVVIIDPRGAFATTERFADVTLIDRWPDEALAELALDSRTAVVTLTHDPKLDDPALTAGLNSDCFYVGALGSRKTHAARLERLRRAGFDEAALKRIHGPVGLAIGAATPEEIAVSILAQMTARLRQGAMI